MIKTKERKCKPVGKAKGFDSCGEVKLPYLYGMCHRCAMRWAYSTPEGDIFLKSIQIRAKTHIQKEAKKEQSIKKEESRSKSYYEKQLQTEINSIVRLLDEDKGCISCDHGWGKPWTRQRHAGHRLSIGSNASLRYNLHNNFGQCSICNNWKSGNERNYDKGIIKGYGQEYLDMIKSLPGLFPSIHLSQEELKEKIQIARSIKKQILDGSDFTREEINKTLDIYK